MNQLLQRKKLVSALALSALIAGCKHSSGPDETQVSVDAGSKAPISDNRQGWWRDEVFYEIFVRSFADADGDGIGDFNGLTARLDYLNDGDPNTKTDLGVGAVWLMPIHKSPSYHGYDVIDYRSVNPQYGTMEDFEAFLKAAHDRGIKVIIDFVINHSSTQHPWFVNARTGKEAQYRDYYVFKDQADARYKRPWDSASLWHPSGQGDHYYGIFWSGMPDLNLANAAVEQEMVEAMRFWLAKGVDGFRVDAVRYLVEDDQGGTSDLPATHALVKRIRAQLHKDYPEALLVAEAWTNSGRVAQYYGDGDEFQLAFSFDAASSVLTSAKDGLRATFNQTMSTIASSISDRGFEAPFLTNHDMERTARKLDNAGANRTAAATLFALPGTPFIYYGEEIGMYGAAESKDEAKRTILRWNDQAPGYGFNDNGTFWYPSDEKAGTEVSTQQADQASLWHLYRSLIELRRGTPALADGEVEPLVISKGGRGTTGMLRRKDGKRVLFLINFHDQPGEDFEIELSGTPKVLFSENMSTAPSIKAGKLFVPALPARGFVFLSLDD